MDVRCERCRSQFSVDQARVPEAGLAVSCGQCGHAFLLRKKVLAVSVPLRPGEAAAAVPLASLTPGSDTPPEAGPRRGFRLRHAGGRIYPFQDLTTLQRWVVERRAGRDDEVSAGGDDWRRLGDVPELSTFFSLVDAADRVTETPSERQAEPPTVAPLAPTHVSPPHVPPPTVVPVPALAAASEPAWATGATAEEDSTAPGPRPLAAAPEPPPPARRWPWVLVALLVVAGAGGATWFLVRPPGGGSVAVPGAAGLTGPTGVTGVTGVTGGVAAPPASAPSQPPSEAAGPTGPTGPAAEGAPTGAVGPTGALAAPESGGTSGSTGPSGPAGATAAMAPEAASAVPAAAPGSSGPTGPAATPPAPPPTKTPLQRARELRDRHRCEAALDVYAQVLASEPTSVPALAGRGICYLELSRYEQAEASFRAALDADPKNGEALYGMAETCRYMGRNGEAVEYYQRFLEVRPTGEDAAAARKLITQLKE